MAADRRQALARLTKDTLIDLLGIRILEAGDGRALAEMEFRADLRQPTGLLHGGALLSLADTTATFAALTVVDPEGGEFDFSRFPLAIQLSANFMANVDKGKITCEAEAVHRGRSTIVVEAKVRSESGRLLAPVTVTLLVPRRKEG